MGIAFKLVRNISPTWHTCIVERSRLWCQNVWWPLQVNLVSMYIL